MHARAHTQMAQKEHEERPARSHGRHDRLHVLDTVRAKLARVEWRYKFGVLFLGPQANADHKIINRAWRCQPCKTARLNEFQHSYWARAASRRIPNLAQELQENLGHLIQKGNERSIHFQQNKYRATLNCPLHRRI